jgi:protein-arginine kinase activator protein McsA
MLLLWRFVFGCPIFTYEFILSSAGILLDDESIRESQKNEEEELLEEENPAPKKTKEDIASMSTADLEKRLNEAIANEEYERASRIRDELNNRKK